MNLEASTALVTGAAGWLGRRLVHVLARGLPDHEALCRPKEDLAIRCLVLPGQDERPLTEISDRVEVTRGDVRRAADCETFVRNAAGAVLFHVAGVIHPQRRVKEFYETNVGGTENLLRAAVEAGVRRAVVVSSNSPCGCNRRPDELFTEDSPYNPYMNYGRSKMLMESAVRRFQESGQIETVLVRAPWFYGPYQPPRQTLFFEMIRRGKMPILGDGNHRRSMAYIDNLCQGLILAATTARANGKTYWIADERPYTINEIVGTVERLMQSEFDRPCTGKRLRLPHVVGTVAEMMDGAIQRLGFYHQKIHVLSEMNKTIACSVERAKRELGYQPVVALEEGMRRALQWLQTTKGQPC